MEDQLEADAEAQSEVDVEEARSEVDVEEDQSEAAVAEVAAPPQLWSIAEAEAEVAEE